MPSCGFMVMYDSWPIMTYHYPFFVGFSDWFLSRNEVRSPEKRMDFKDKINKTDWGMIFTGSYPCIRTNPINANKPWFKAIWITLNSWLVEAFIVPHVPSHGPRLCACEDGIPGSILRAPLGRDWLISTCHGWFQHVSTNTKKATPQ